MSNTETAQLSSVCTLRNQGVICNVRASRTRICSFTNRFTQNNRAQLLQQALQPGPPKSLPRVTPCQAIPSPSPGCHISPSGAEEDEPQGAWAVSADSAGLTALIWEHRAETQSVYCTAVKNKPPMIARSQCLGTGSTGRGV